jgi:hypothetical protein
MDSSYGFVIDLDDFTQEGNNRIFNIQSDPEQLKKFIEDNELFKDVHSGCVCDCEKNYGRGCLNPKAYWSGGCK